jgi:hypothetical protein
MMQKLMKNLALLRRWVQKEICEIDHRQGKILTKDWQKSNLKIRIINHYKYIYKTKQYDVYKLRQKEQ